MIGKIGYGVGLFFLIGLLIVSLIFFPPLALVIAPFIMLCFQGIGVVPK